MLALPPEWVPPFIALVPAATQPTGSAVAPAIERLLERAEQWVLVRSDGPFEGRRAAQGESFVVPSRASAVLAAVGRMSDGEEAPSTWPLVQVAVDPAMLGVMSNERRLTSNPRAFVAEGLLSLRGVERRRVTVESASPSPTPLEARCLTELEFRLRDVASGLIELAPDAVIRCEWAWDGERLWILQADRLKDGPGRHQQSWLARGGRKKSRRLPVPDADRWPKIRKARLFGQLGWPAAGSVIVEGGKVSSAAMAAALERHGIAPTPQTPVVVRTDIAGKQQGTMLLPTSPPCTSQEELDRFIHDAAGNFAEWGITPNDWALLVAPLLAAQASAFVHAEPGTRTANVDALWGFPDGLLFLPHDRYDVDLASRRVRTHVCHKPACLVPGNGEWQIEPLAAPWDWRRALSDAEAIRLGAWACALADRLGSSVQLMALARVDGRRGEQGCIPFHYTTASGGPPSWRGGPSTQAVVSDWPDIERLPERPLAIQLVPVASRLRDVRFLQEVARRARETRSSVVLHGSLLAHAFYVLQNAGAPLVVASGTDGDADDLAACLWRTSHDVTRVVGMPRDLLAKFVDQQLAAPGGETAATDIQRPSRASGARTLDALPVVNADELGSDVDTSQLSGIPGISLEPWALGET